VYDFESLDHYEILGVSRAASTDEIKRAYRREIAKYHPDRVTNASPAEREYAELRAQRVNEAYRVLSDFGLRTTYNAGDPSPRRTPRTTPTPPSHRDYPAELYEQAREHLEANRPLQAIAVLRQLQQLSPLYRDSAELMARAKARVGQRTETSGSQGRSFPRRALLIGGIGGAVAIVSALAWSFGRGPIQGASATLSAPTAFVAAHEATPLPIDTPLSASLTPTLPPTQTASAVPSPTATAIPTPSSIPTSAPEATLSATNTLLAPLTATVPVGRVLLSDSFDIRSWADLDGRGWTVGYTDGGYRITADAGLGPIWSYRTGPDGDLSYAVDVQGVGEAGLLVRFMSENEYVIGVVDSGAGSYRVIQLRGGRASVLASGTSDAIQTGESMNRLEARLNGTALTLLTNGITVANVELGTVNDSPRYGLVVVGGANAANALFDNLEIRTRD
jgi:hypothetical protein